MVRGGAELAPLKLVLALAFDVGHNHGQHLYCARQFPLFCKPYASSWRERKRATTYINQGRGLSPLPKGKKRCPIIRSITHAPDQTNRRPRPIHCSFDLAAPTYRHVTSEGFS